MTPFSAKFNRSFTRSSACTGTVSYRITTRFGSRRFKSSSISAGTSCDSGEPAANSARIRMTRRSGPRRLSSATSSSGWIRGTTRGAAMNVQEYKRRLLDLEARLSDRTTRAQENARAQALDGPGDVGEASVADESQSEELTEAELDATVLQQVRDALQRIDDG